MRASGDKRMHEITPALEKRRPKVCLNDKCLVYGMFSWDLTLRRRIRPRSGYAHTKQPISVGIRIAFLVSDT